MTKKDYIKLAKSIKKRHNFIPHEFILELCDILKDDNPRFDREQFIKIVK